MKGGYLLDTHYLIWWLQGDKRKLGKAWAFIASNRCFASSVSIWEMRQKEQTGRVRFDTPNLMSLLVAGGITEITLNSEHVETAFGLNAMHSDMHDRLLVATAKVSGLTFVTRDGEILERAAALLRGRMIEI